MMRNSRRTISEESELVNQREDRVTTHSSRLNANAHAIELLDGGRWLEKHNRGKTHRGRLIEILYIRVTTQIFILTSKNLIARYRVAKAQSKQRVPTLCL